MCGWMSTKGIRDRRTYAAIACTLIGTAKLNDVDPQAWLTNVLSRIAGHPINRVAEPAPWHFRA
jgi:hypothetical protein